MLAIVTDPALANEHLTSTKVEQLTAAALGCHSSAVVVNRVPTSPRDCWGVVWTGTESGDHPVVDSSPQRILRTPSITLLAGV